jgi:hypothetical protein
MKITINYKILSVVLLLVVLVLVGQMGLNVYSGYIVETMSDSYTAGYGDGVAAAVSQLVVQTGSCNPVPVRFGNVTRTLIDLACFQMPQEQQAPQEQPEE